MAKKLTPKQARFVEEYCAALNATEAARRAGYSEKTAGAIGHENLTKPEIKQAVARRLDELSMTAEEATKRLTDIGRGSLAPFMRITASGEVTFDLSTKEAQDHLHLIRKIEVLEPRHDDDGNEVVAGRIKLELYDAKDAQIQMAKIRGMFVERHEHAGPDGGPVEISVVRKVVGGQSRITAYQNGAAGKNGGR